LSSDADAAAVSRLLNVAARFGDVSATVGRAFDDPLETVTVTLVFDELPAASRAVAVSLWRPFGVFVVSQTQLHGAWSSLLRGWPSRWKSTRVTPTLSLALTRQLADGSLSDPLTVAPDFGLLQETAGGVLSPAGDGGWGVDACRWSATTPPR